MDKKQLRMFYDLGIFRDRLQSLHRSLNGKKDIKPTFDEIQKFVECLFDFFEGTIDEILSLEEK